jgi:hypothetical protein
MLQLALVLSVLGLGRGITSTPIFQAYKGYPPCFRQPVLVVINPQTLLAFAGTTATNALLISLLPSLMS